MENIAVTHCFLDRHFEFALRTIPEWMKAFPDRKFIVGYYKRRCPESFVGSLAELGVEYHEVTNKFYGKAYEYLLNTCDWNSVLIFAPYSVPQSWLAGSIQQWLNDYALIGKFRPPRLLNAENLMLPLVAPVVVELGRLNFDFLVIRHDLKFSIDTKYYSWRLGSVMVRARPGAFMIFNALALGCPILTLPHGVKPVRFLGKKR